ncbi:hypothetical protein FDP41_001912 [Naegleria fowleri]|uniref:Uncharacterized protein n=1 Tax=Naegleria fowleri TaxID=5763 RepID=A0A6A5BW35_NAEFO|nr:uncharacterized protein FDP41_001912 [Naegleria fowleri]KAF0978842.1 hypothetical protein FDP41_001912 [Naegleria fowleri]CAG4717353.1 unnamed protein product [Naegleria fowleri]
MKIIKRPGQQNPASEAEAKMMNKAIPLRKTSWRFLFIVLVSLGSVFAGAETAHRIFKPDITIKPDLPSLRSEKKSSTN